MDGTTSRWGQCGEMKIEISGESFREREEADGAVYNGAREGKQPLKGGWSRIKQDKGSLSGFISGNAKDCDSLAA